MCKRFQLMLILSAALSGTACGKNTGEVSQAEVTTADMVTVPAGEFIMGSNKTDKDGLQQQYGFEEPLFVGENPEHKVTLPAYRIDVYEVTNAQYKDFLLKARGMGKVPQAWRYNGYGLARSQADAMDVETLRNIAVNHFMLDMDTRVMDKDALLREMFKKQAEMDTFAVTGVTWNDADAYCRWRGKRLPSEAEWEKAARGPKGLEYPWGNEWDAAILNTGDNADTEEGIVAVGSYPRNKSPYGAYDMAGNAWEWVSDWYEPYPGSAYKSDAFGKKSKIIRGGGGGAGHYSMSYFFRSITRQHAAPDMSADDVGIRCAKDM